MCLLLRRLGSVAVFVVDRVAGLGGEFEKGLLYAGAAHFDVAGRRIGNEELA